MSLIDKLASERRARLAAERMLKMKAEELFEANRKLSHHARALSGQVVEQQRNIDTIRLEAEELRTTAATYRDEATTTRQHLQDATLEVEVSRQRLLDSMEALSDGMAIFDAQDRLVTANAAWLELFDGLGDVKPGISYLDLVTLAADQGIVDIGDQTRDRWVTQMIERWDAPEIPELTMQLWDGRWLRHSDHRTENRDTVTLIVDITEQRQREEAFKAASEQAEAATRAKSAFLANMSHELRTPMNGIVGMADLLTESELDEEEQLYVETIRSSGHALLNIINDVLDYSKLEAEKMDILSEPFELESLIHEIVLLMQPTAQEKSLELAVDCDLFLPTDLKGDAGRLRQVLTNLIGNAIKFTSEGHVLVRLVGVYDEAQKTVDLRIAVEDTGIGIPEDKLSHIFAQFTQVENERNRRFDGTGLGLAISQQLVELMGGEMWVTSTVGQGSVFGFRLTLPCTSAPQDIRRRPAAGLDAALVVGGSNLQNEILRTRLGQLGLSVTLVHNGSDALKAVAEGVAHDLLLVDHTLEDTDGLQLIEALREQGNTTPAVLMTSLAKHVDQDKADRLNVQVQRRHLRGPALMELLAEQEVTKPDLVAAWEEDRSTDTADGVDATDGPDGGSTDDSEGRVVFKSTRFRSGPSQTEDLANDEGSLIPDTSPAEASSSEGEEAPANAEIEPAQDPEARDDAEGQDALSAEIHLADEVADDTIGAKDVQEDDQEAQDLDESETDSLEDPPLGDASDPEPTDALEANQTPELQQDAVIEGTFQALDTPAPGETPEDQGLTVEDEPAVELAQDPSQGPDPETGIQAGEPLPDVQETESAQSDEPAEPAEEELRKMRILAAEDNRTNQLVFRKMLKSLNIDLMMVENGRLAVEAYQSFEPDLVFMDISMPEMDGKQATAAIRDLERESGHHTPIVALTAHAMAGDGEAILEAGLDYYLTKPLKKSVILSKIFDLAPQDCAELSLQNSLSAA